MLVYLFIIRGLASLSSGDLLPVDTKVVIRTTIQQLTIGGGSGRAEATMQKHVVWEVMPLGTSGDGPNTLSPKPQGFCQLEEYYEDRSSLEVGGML